MGKIYLRKAMEEDRELLLVWANEEECRKNSLNQRIITIEEHNRWFEKNFHSGGCQIYILMDGDVCIGQARLESTDGRGRISYSIDKKNRGMGYGKLLLSLMLQAAVTDFPLCKELYAEVRKDNVASQKVFEQYGFILDKEENGIYRYIINHDRVNGRNPYATFESNITVN